MMKLHQLVCITLLPLSLAACDFFSANWEEQDGACVAVSSEKNVMAMIRRDGIAFVDLEPGCANNLDGLGTRFTEIAINGEPYPAMVMCHDATHQRNVITVGAFNMAIKEKAALAALSAKAAAEFTGLLGAKVSLEGKTAHFHKGNFIPVCAKYLPPPPNVGSNAANTPPLTLNDLNTLSQANRGTPPQPAAEPPATVKQITPSLNTLTPDMYDEALEQAQHTYLLSHPGADLSNMVWEQLHRPDKERHGQMMRMLRYTTFNPATGITSDIDVEIAPDGTVGDVVSNDHPSSSTTVPEPAPAPAHPPVDLTVSAFCTLDNGKSVSVSGAPEGDYRYTYSDKYDRQELAMTDGLFGVKAFHYYTRLGMGAAQYIRFNKGTYDYVLLNKDTGKDEFHGIRVYNNGTLISSHECITPLTLNTENLPQNDHADSDKAGDYFTQ